MKLSHILPLVALGGAFVIPEEQVLSELTIEPRESSQSVIDKLPSFDGIKDTFGQVVKSSKNALDDALASVVDVKDAAYEKYFDSKFDVDSWLSSAPLGGGDDPPPHNGPGGGPPVKPPGKHPGKPPGKSPGHGPPGDGPPDHDPHHGPPHHGPPHHGPPHKGPRHPPHHGKPNLTIYEMISKSKYTTKLAKLIEDDADLVKLLNGTAANYTVFAPTDAAFEKIPEHAHKPSKETIKKILLYHISPDFYPAGRVLASHTIPTMYNESALGAEPLPQRLAVKLGLKGLTLNYYSRVVAINIFATNGVIHGVDSILLPPPSTLTILNLLPGEFSTLLLGLAKTGLGETLNTTAHAGGTFFAPSNFAFQKLGPRINAFLFSSYGQKYLKALLEYHVVVNQTLYSDAFYKLDEAENTLGGPKKGLFHVDLPTLLEDRSLSIDIARYGPFISIKINGFGRVAIQDGIAKDGVIQVVADVLIPPKKLGDSQVVQWSGEEMSVDEFKARLEPLVQNGEKKSGSWFGGRFDL